MQKYDIGILIPAIRTNRWVDLYNSIALSCKNHTWQLVLVSPFALPKELSHHTNIKIISEFGQVSRAVQRGMLEVDSDLVFLTVDDCVMLEDAIDKCILQYKAQCSQNDVLNMRYSEGGDIWNIAQYTAGFHGALRIHGVDPKWQIAPQFLMDKNYFVSIGGFDCRYEYINEPVHDFMFRVQLLGGSIIHSDTHCCIATHYPETTKDHAPIHHAQLGHDYPIFIERYRNGQIDLIIDYDNWKNTPAIWNRRFNNGVSHSYEELIQKEGYNI